MVHEQGDDEVARALYEESLQLQRERNDRQGIGFALNNLGLLAHEQGDDSRGESTASLFV